MAWTVAWWGDSASTGQNRLGTEYPSLGHLPTPTYEDRVSLAHSGAELWGLWHGQWRGGETPPPQVRASWEQCSPFQATYPPAPVKTVSLAHSGA